LSAPGAFFAGCAGLTLSPDEAAFFRASDPLGFILFSRNIDTPDQILRLTGDLRAAVGRDAPILIDQEGGRVQRLRAPHWREWIAPLDEVARAGVRAPQVMTLRYRVIAAELRAIGIDVNCAPCADIARANTHPVLLNRCYGKNAPTAASIGRAVADGLLAGGVLPVLKHIPGHGAATADSHLELPHVDLPRETLRDQDFAAFRALADLPMAMTGHIVFDAIDATASATQSPAMIALIRDDIGFDGLLMSDDISMHALSGDMGARCLLSLKAGCDVILHCNGEMAEMEQVAAASGTLGSQAQARADHALALRDVPAEDAKALADQWQALMAEGAA